MALVSTDFMHFVEKILIGTNNEQLDIRSGDIENESMYKLYE